ncbi:MAG: hypothetical protein Q8P67_08675 [archaeon]|nr:hypothetical protein [archaeon]
MASSSNTVPNAGAPGKGLYLRQHSGSVESLAFRSDRSTRVTYQRTFDGFEPHKYRGHYTLEGTTLTVNDADGEELLKMDLKTFHEYWVKQTTITHEVHDSNSDDD